jgi:hypothetical protein
MLSAFSLCILLFTAASFGGFLVEDAVCSHCFFELFIPVEPQDGAIPAFESVGQHRLYFYSCVLDGCEGFVLVGIVSAEEAQIHIGDAQVCCDVDACNADEACYSRVAEIEKGPADGVPYDAGHFFLSSRFHNYSVVIFGFLQCSFDLDDFIEFEQVAGLDVVVFCKFYTALESCFHLAGIILEVFEGLDCKVWVD